MTMTKITATTTTATTESSQSSPCPELQRAICQFQQVLWTPCIPKAISILQSHPSILSHQNKIGFLPLHKAIKCTQSAYRSEIIKLIIEEGIRHDICNDIGVDYGNCNDNGNGNGNENGSRGGLLVRSKDRNRSALCLLVVGDDKTDILQYLVSRSPTPLLSSQDVIDYQLLHTAAGDPFLFKDRVHTLRFLIDLCPTSFKYRNDAGDLPIHHLCKQPGYSTEMLQMFLNEGVANGVYLEKDGKGRPLLQCCMEEHVLPLLKSLEYDNVPILQDVIGVVSSEKLRIIIDTLEFFKPWCSVRDKERRLPLHTAAEVGLKWEEEMKDILNANVFAACEIDPKTNLYPFLLAASSANASTSTGDDTGTNANTDADADVGKKEGSCDCDLTSIYKLARMNPNCVGFQN
jgi:hypothetical protein